jgi:hypothetical protein
MPFQFLPGSGEINALIAPAGTSIPMAQATAPNGWTSSAISDTSLRYSSGSGGVQGGSLGWSAWNFGGVFNVNSFTISTAQLPPHNHGISDPGHAHGVSDSGHSHTPNGGGQFVCIVGNSGSALQFPGNFPQVVEPGSTNTVATGIGIQAAATNVTTQNTGSNSAITPNFTTPQVKYCDHILAVKS